MDMTALEQELLRYLADRITNEFGDAVKPYSSTQDHASAGPHDEPPRFELAFELRLWDEGGGTWRAPVICRDVLDAYSKLPAGLTQDRTNLLDIHGEPGAGKSCTMARLSCGLARAVMQHQGDHTLHVPLLLQLSQWTRPGESFSEFLARHWHEGGYPLLARDWAMLQGQRPLLLLLDGRDEIPDALQLEKNDFLYDEVESREAITAWAGLIGSRTTPSSQATSAMNTLELLPLPAEQVLEYLRHRAAARPPEPIRDIIGTAVSPAAKPPTVPAAMPTDTVTHGMPLFMRRPYWLSMWASQESDVDPLNCKRHDLVDTYLADRHARGRQCYGMSHRAEQVPRQPEWTRALRALALTLVLPHGQTAWRHGARLRAYSSLSVLCDAPTAMTRAQVEGQLAPSMLEFSLHVQVLQQRKGLYFFQHQLLQEVLAAGSLLSACAADPQGASVFWPASTWWRNTGWERVAMIAAELLDGDVAAVHRFVFWLAQAQPEVALQAWHAAGRPPLGAELPAWIRAYWQPGMTDPVRWPAPAARAAIGRALAGFDLDDRHGIGLRPDGLPDIDWVEFSDGLPFIFQDAEHPGLPPFAISRYPITVRQYQVFVDAPDGHVDARWWHGIEQWQYQSFWVVPNDTSSPGEWRRYEEIPRGILQPDIPDTNCPRGDVTWYQATAYCRWLSHHLGQEISLPTERQWERVARGRHGGDTPVRRATIQPAT